MTLFNADHLPAKWEPLVKRLAGTADRECTNRGFAIIKMVVLVDPKGEPRFWREPEVIKLEPRLGASDFLDEILRMCGEGVVLHK